MSLKDRLFKRSLRLPQLAFFAGMVPVVLVWGSLRHQDDLEGQRQFDLHVREIVNALDKRLRQHEQILLGGAGLFDANAQNGQVSRRQWKAYVERLRLPENYPGIQGVGYSQVIAPAALPAHIKSVRAEGFPEYTVRPPGSREHYTSIVMLEPFTGRNLAAFGYDMYSEETRRAAMQRAAQSGKTAISGKVRLVQETHGRQQAGFLMYVPVYARGVLPTDPAQAWSQLRGFVYSPYRVDDLMAGILGERSEGIHLRIYDGNELTAATLMHDSVALTKTGKSAATSAPRFVTQHRLEAFGHRWTLLLESRPGYEAQFRSDFELLVLALGFASSLLLAALTASLSHRRERAQALAEEMTARSRVNEQALSESLQQLRTVIDSVIDGIITIDERGQVLSFNPAAERIFGYPASEVVGANVRMLMPEPNRSAHDGYLSKYKATGVAGIIGIGREVEAMRRDGQLFTMELAVSVASHGGERIFIGLVRDVTERKRVDRMKSEFVSTVSHELRTPLTSIAGSLGLLVSGKLGQVPAPMQPLLEIANKNSQRLARLIDDLLDMEKMVAGKMEFDMQPRAIMPLVEQAIEAMTSYAQQHQVRLSLVQRDEQARARVDEQRLLQVLANLLSNATKFSPEGGVVEVLVRVIDGWVDVTVKDYGPGIPVDFQGRIFSKFSQADSSDTRRKGGTGLGLAISKGLVEKMGGSIGFDSQVNEGTEFHCRFPQLP